VVRLYLIRFVELEIEELDAGACPMYGLHDPVVVTTRIRALLARFVERENTATTS
jgi:hypothetical protein